MDKDLAAALASLLKPANTLLGTKATDWDELFDAIMPPQYCVLRRLTGMYEREMIACRDGQAYFSACIMGAAMLEGYLLLLCFANQHSVERTQYYRSRSANKEKQYEQNLCRYGLDDLIEISAELNWIPTSIISDEWKKALPEAYLDIVAERHPNKNHTERARDAAALVSNPAYSLMIFLNTIRNRLHAGRWIRNEYQFTNDAAFSDWAKVALVAATHIRDCLVTHRFRDLIEVAKTRLWEKLAGSPLQ